MGWFITETLLKDFTGISKNVDPQDVMPSVQQAAEMFISPILGREFFDYLVTAYNAQTLNADETILVEHIQSAVAWRSAEMAMPLAAYQWKNKGVQSQTGEFSSNVDWTTLSYLRNEYKNRAEYYEGRVARYLELNEDLYPGYTASSNKTDTPPEDTDGWDLGSMMIV